MSVVNTSNMSLPVPVVGVEAGPQYAQDVNNCLTILDAHSHSPGSGVPITPSAMNINSDLPYQNNNATSVRSVRFQLQPSVISQVTDVGCLYAAGVDLYYNDGSGNQIRITQSGGVAGTPGSISNLVAPASASYVSANSTFVFQSAANTAASLDGRNLLLRNSSASSNALTISPPTAMGANYSLTMPPLPSQQNIMTLDAAGNMSAPWNVDNVTLQVSGNLIQVITAAIMPVGSMIAYGGTSAPTNFLICDGSSLDRTTYATLFAVLGTAYGAADSTHFNLPDLRGRFVRGVDNGAGHDPDAATRTASNTGGNTGDNVGSYQADQNKSHNHTLTDPGHSHTIVTHPTVETSGLARPPTTPDGGVTSTYGANSNTTGITIATSGGNQSNPVNVYANYIIKYQ